MGRWSDGRGDHVDDRKLHGKPASALEFVDPPDLEVVLLERSEAAHEGAFRGGAADVNAESPGQGPGLQELNRIAPGSHRPGNAAAVSLGTALLPPGSAAGRY